MSDTSDALGCFRPDLIGHDGSPGIDNALGQNLETLESLTASDFDQAFINDIRDGRLVTVFELRNIDGSEFDECVDLFVHDAVYADDGPHGGRPDSRQVVRLLPDTARHFAAARMVRGVLRASGGAFPMGVDISGGKFLIDVQAVELTLNLRGPGLLGGELRVRDFVRGAECGRVPYPPELVDGFFTDAADLRPQPDGECGSFSVAMVFEQVPVRVE